MEKYGYKTSLVPGECLRVKGACFEEFEFCCHGLCHLTFYVGDHGKLIVQIYPYDSQD